MRRRPPPRILLAFSNAPPDDPQHLRALGDERRAIRRALADAEKARLCAVDVEVDANPDELIARLRAPEAQEVVLFHYAGHASGDILELEDPAYAEGVAQLLAQLPRLRLVFLNGCSTRPQVDRLLELGVPAVIATERAIDDTTATEVATQFYEALASGAFVREAFEAAAGAVQLKRGDGAGLWREGAQRSFAPAVEGEAAAAVPWALHAADDDEDFSLPALVEDPLFGLPRVAQAPPAQPFVGNRPYTAKEARVFFGRGDDTRAMYDALHGPKRTGVLLVTGGPGVGKTSLIQAGLLPRIPDAWPLVLDAQHDPHVVLARALNVPVDLLAIEAAWRARAEQQTPVLVIDGAHADLEGLDHLIRGLAPALADGVGHVVLCSKPADAEPVLQVCGRAGVVPRRVHVDPLSAAQVGAIVAGVADDPDLAGSYQIQLDPLLPARLVADLADAPVVAPILSVVLEGLWSEALGDNPEAPRLTVDAYARLRAEGQLLGPFVDRQLKALRASHPAALASGLALDVLAWHTNDLGVAVPQATGALRARYVDREEEEVEALRAALVDLRLLAPLDGEADRSRLANRALGRLIRARYAKSTAPGQQAARVLARRGIEGDDGSEPEPLDRFDLARVESGLTGIRALNEQEALLLERSRQAVALRRRNFRIFWWVIALGVVGATAAVLINREAKVEAEEAGNEAVANEVKAQQAKVQALRTAEQSERLHLASISQLMEDEDPTAGALAAALIERPDRLPRAQAEVAQAASRRGLAVERIAAHTRWTYGAHCIFPVSPEGVDEARRIILRSGAQAVALGPFGERLAVDTLGARARRHDCWDHTPAQRRPVGELAVKAVLQSRYGELPDDGADIPAPFSEPSPYRTFGPATADVNAMVYTADGRRLVTGTFDGRVLVQTLETEALQEALKAGIGWCLSPDFRTFHLGETLAEATTKFEACQAGKTNRQLPPPAPPHPDWGKLRFAGCAAPH